MTKDFLAQFLLMTLVPVGAFAIIISSLGVVGNFFEWDAHSCWGPQPVYAVCGSILWFIIEFLVLASTGAGLAIVGFGVRLPKVKPQVA